MANPSYARTQTISRTAEIDVGLRAYMNKVYALMAGALVITGVVAYAIGTTPALVQALFGTPLVWLVMLSPLAFVMVLSFGIHKMSAATAHAVFWVYAAFVGASISLIFVVYTGHSIARTFFITAAAFGALSLYGYTTKKDLSGMGSFLIMGLFGLIIAMVVNIFLASSALDFAISCLGVLIFAGLTAWDTQRIKSEYLALRSTPGGDAYLEKGAILGALHLYLDFVNLFMFLLQFLGNRE